MPCLTLALFAVAALAPAAPVPKAVKKVPAYPVDVGTKWEYIEDGNPKWVHVWEITESVEKNGVRVIRVDMVDAEGDKEFRLFEVAHDAVRLIRSDAGEVMTPRVMRKATLTEGDSWTIEYSSASDSFSSTIGVGKEESIVTPAGQFNAVPLTQVFEQSKQWAEQVEWYADGVGLVKQTHAGRKKPVLELKSFTPGKK